MRHAFFTVGPTAIGKSELAADVASEIGAEIVSADAFQIYRGLDLLTAKPDASTLAKAPHHLIGTTSLHEKMNAEKYHRDATRAIRQGRPREIASDHFWGAQAASLFFSAACRKTFDPDFNAIGLPACRRQAATTAGWQSALSGTAHV
jgi:hypothetical protein